ncbi:MAG TPA: alpha/beta hydrolase [Galbitalea sp.]|nr:alpha/beta hydrolase [Galbitalea sp.]
MIPLEEVAPDAVALIAAFRESGGSAFGTLPVEESRANYRASCERNGLPPASVAEVVDLRSPTADGGSIALRHYHADLSQPKSAAIVFIHGGGWALGDLETHDRICRSLSTSTCLPVIAIDYRLAPEHPYPVPLNDCRSALEYVRDNAVSLGIDPTRLVLVGDSAGGGIVAVLANDPSMAVVGTRIIGQVLLYPVTDLASESESYQRLDEGFPLTAGSMRWFADLYLESGFDRADPRVSPLRLAHLVPSPPRAFLISLGLDPLGDEGIAYAAHLARHGATVEHHHLPHHAHGIFTSAGKIETGRLMLQRAADFIVGGLE